MHAEVLSFLVALGVGGDEEGGIRIGDIYIPPPPLPACALDQEGPRLVITHIENHNFKSYAGRQVSGSRFQHLTVDQQVVS